MATVIQDAETGQKLSAREAVAVLREANPDITVMELAEAIGVTDRRIRQILDEGNPPRKTQPDTTTTPGQPPAPKKASKNDKLAEKLCDPIAKLAIPLSFTLPTVAAVLVTRGEATAVAIVALAADHPRMLAALEKVSKVGPATDLAETGIMLVIAASLDLGKLPREHPLAMLTGVGGLYDQTHPKPPTDNGQVFHAPFPSPGVPQP